MCQNNVSANVNYQQILPSDPQQQLTATSSHHQLTVSAGQDEPQQQSTITVQHQLTEAASQQHLHNQLTTLAGLRKQEEQQLLSYAADKRQTPAAGSQQQEQLTNGRVQQDGPGGKPCRDTPGRPYRDTLDRACQSANSSPYPARLRHPILDHHRLQQASYYFLTDETLDYTQGSKKSNCVFTFRFWVVIASLPCGIVPFQLK
jgi:hypothetical protein